MIRFQPARSAALAIALFAGVASAGLASAQGPSAQNEVDAIVVRSHRPNDSNVRTVKVGFADLDIHTDQGATALANRLVAAADEACGGLPAPRASSPQKLEFSECRTNAMYDAVHTVGSPVLTRITHGGRAPALRSD